MVKFRGLLCSSEPQAAVESQSCAVSEEPRALTSVRFRRARLGPQAPPQDVLVAGGRVAEIGDIEGRAQTAEVFEVDGPFLLPGLWDRHVHFDQWAQIRARLDLSGVETAAAAARSVATYIANSQQDLDMPVVGYGFRDALWPDAPHRDVLDEMCGELPVVLISADLHSAWLSTAALRRFGHAGHPTR